MDTPPQPRLLIVEDDPAIAAALRKYGESNGYFVQHADNGDRAVELGRRERFDVLLLDISLPGKDGRDVLVELREAGAVDRAVVVFLSARDGQSDRRLGIELGADDYESKPVHFASLFRKLARLREKKLAAG